MALLLKIILLGFGLIVALGLLYWLGLTGFFFFIFRDQSGYEIKNSKVFYTADGTAMLDVVGADAGSFKSLSQGKGRYGQDKNNIYYKQEKIESVDRASFRPLDLDKFGSWARDKNHVYYSGSAIQDADPASFRVIDTDFIADQNQVFIRINEAATGNLYFQLVKNADPASFVPIEYSWSREYGKDKNAIFYKTSAISGANRNTFKVVGGGYTADDKNVYYNGVVVIGADAQSIQAIEESMDIVKDKKHWYYEGKVGTMKDGDFVPSSPK